MDREKKHRDSSDSTDSEMDSKESEMVVSNDVRPLSPSAEASLIMESSKKKVNFLRDVATDLEQSIVRSENVQKHLAEERDMILKVKDLQKRQQQIISQNRELFLRNQQDGLALQHLENARETRAPVVLSIDYQKRPGSCPPIKQALEKRPPTPSKTKEVIDKRLQQAEEKRASIIAKKIQALHKRDAKHAENKALLEKQKAEEEEERRKKAAEAAERQEKRQQQLKEEEKEARERRLQRAQELKAKYEQDEAKYKGLVGEPAPIRDLHQQQKEKLELLEKERLEQVNQKLEKLRVQPSDAESLARLTKGETVLPKPVPSLKEAEERRENPEKFRTPKKESRSRAKPLKEELLHSRIVTGIEKLKLHAATSKEREQLEADLLLEKANHLRALQRETKDGGLRNFFEGEEKDEDGDDLPVLEKRFSQTKAEEASHLPMKLEFKDDTSGKKRRLLTGDRANTMFKPANVDKKKSSRRQAQSASSPTEKENQNHSANALPDPKRSKIVNGGDVL